METAQLEEMPHDHPGQFKLPIREIATDSYKDRRQARRPSIQLEPHVVLANLHRKTSSGLAPVNVCATAVDTAITNMAIDEDKMNEDGQRQLTIEVHPRPNEGGGRKRSLRKKQSYTSECKFEF
jgi:hypothetical protein